MKLRNLSTAIAQRMLNIKFDKKVVCLQGDNADTVLHILASLLAMDYTGAFKLYGELSNTNVDYTIQSTLTTSTATIRGKNKIIEVENNLVDTNIVYYIGGGKTVGYYIGTDNLDKHLNYNLTLSEKLRFIQVFNKLADYEAVYLDSETGNIQTDFVPADGMTERDFQILFDLFYFVFGTQQACDCIVLLPQISCVPMERLIHLLSGISCVSNIVTTVPVNEAFFDKNILDVFQV